MIFSYPQLDKTVEISCIMKQPNGPDTKLSILKSKEEKLLGVILDEQLTFVSHIDYIVRVSYSNITKINTFIDKNYGLPTNLATMLYITYVRSVIESSFMCWCTVDAKQLIKLESIQSLMLRKIAKSMDKYPTMYLM